ncbi:TetR/AcrR family transcriptional regulator [Gordonia paraffinivorans]|uniref:TetR/AcrR family transcriptional regulator n=1 Tax=Gordonia paraffinivorans TaxID=175628 RepID=UPI003FCCB962
MSGSSERAQRADAQRNVEAILAAAIRVLARDPKASVSVIAKEAGVGRVTLYGHFPNRAAVIAAAVDRALAQTTAAIDAARLDEGDPFEALARLVDASWSVTHQHGALLVAAERILPADELSFAHAEPMAAAEAVFVRGQRSGAFRDDISTGWLVTLLHSVTHGASTAVHEGGIDAEDAPRLILATMVGAVTPPGREVPVVGGQVAESVP